MADILHQFIASLSMFFYHYLRGVSTPFLVMQDFWTINSRKLKLRSPDVGTSSARHVFFGFRPRVQPKPCNKPWNKESGSEWLKNVQRCSSGVKFKHAWLKLLPGSIYRSSIAAQQNLYIRGRNLYLNCTNVDLWSWFKQIQNIGYKTKQCQCKTIPAQKFDSEMRIVSLKVCMVKIKFIQSQELFGVPLFHFVSLQHLFPCSNLQCEPRRNREMGLGKQHCSFFVYHSLMAGVVSNTILPWQPKNGF